MSCTKPLKKKQRRAQLQSIPDGSDPELFVAKRGINQEEWQAHVEQALAGSAQQRMNMELEDLVCFLPSTRHFFLLTAGEGGQGPRRVEGKAFYTRAAM